MAFSFFRVEAILQGVYKRSLQGMRVQLLLQYICDCMWCLGLAYASDAPIPLLTNQSDTDIFCIEIGRCLVDTDT